MIKEYKMLYTRKQMTGLFLDITSIAKGNTEYFNELCYIT